MAKAVMITGDKELDKTLSRLTGAVQKRVVYAGLRKAGPIMSKAIKQRVPSRYKMARAAIGWRFDTARKSKKGIAGARAGAGVGKKTKARERHMEKAEARAGSSRPGVGISRQNIHWFLLGSDTRRQYTTGRRTGRMPDKKSLVQSAYASVKTQVVSAMKTRILQGIEKEKQKAAAKVGKVTK